MLCTMVFAFKINFMIGYMYSVMWCYFHCQIAQKYRHTIYLSTWLRLYDQPCFESLDSYRHFPFWPVDRHNRPHYFIHNFYKLEYLQSVFRFKKALKSEKTFQFRSIYITVILDLKKNKLLYSWTLYKILKRAPIQWAYKIKFPKVCFFSFCLAVSRTYITSIS